MAKVQSKITRHMKEQEKVIYTARKDNGNQSWDLEQSLRTVCPSVNMKTEYEWKMQEMEPTEKFQNGNWQTEKHNIWNKNSLNGFNSKLAMTGKSQESEKEKQQK